MNKKNYRYHPIGNPIGEHVISLIKKTIYNSINDLFYIIDRLKLLVIDILSVTKSCNFLLNSLKLYERFSHSMILFIIMHVISCSFLFNSLEFFDKLTPSIIMSTISLIFVLNQIIIAVLINIYLTRTLHLFYYQYIILTIQSQVKASKRN